jgi:hypothetical protein
VALAIEVGQSCEVQSPKAAREDTDGQEEVWSTRHPLGPVGGQASRRQDTVEMGVMVELLAPGMEHGEPADLCAEMRGVPGDVLKRLGDRAKKEPIEQTRVLQRQGTQVVRQGKDPMDVWRVEHLALPGREPRGLGRAMAFGAAPVAARVIRLHFVPTVVALGDMSAQSGRATQRDRAQCPVLRPREGVPIALEKDVAMLAVIFLI